LHRSQADYLVNDEAALNRRERLHPASDATGVYLQAAFRKKFDDMFAGERIS
jgi:hypothetical protein